ncbi:LexA family protein [Gynurincola endophyticus]|jgi:DNA polymerase V|uniref:LexA family protein n=1 Tax=Gynurincola endophyticus TaxID=2479004 RepID=UPI000F8DB254|nr:translesion error-prone DNA polymerase V autoproteolytic subunit [Gynurincola endophyticus]
MPPSIFKPVYTGSKDFDQWQIESADATGFGSAADDYIERGIDLNEALLQNKPATFFMRVDGDAMEDAGIYDGDLLVVDRSLTPRNGQIIIAAIYGDMLIRRMEKTFNKLRLVPATKKLPALQIDPACESFSVWGVVTYVIHKL